jgi:hypothetical protein
MLGRSALAVAAFSSLALVGCGGSLATPPGDAGAADAVVADDAGTPAVPPDAAAGTPQGDTGAGTAGGATRLVQLQGEPHEMLVDGSNDLYLTASIPWTGQDALYRVPLDGSAPVQLTKDFWLYSMALDVDAVYVTAGSSGYGGPERVLRVGKTDGSKLALTTPCDQMRTLGPIAVDATYVYYGCEDYSYYTNGTNAQGGVTYLPGFIARMPKTGGAVQMLAPTVYYPSALVVVGTTLYFAEQGGGSVESCPVSDCSQPTMLAPHQWHPRSMSLVGSSLVWGAGYGTDHTFSWSVPLAGGAAPTQLAPDDWFRWFGADSSGIYWTFNGPDASDNPTQTLYRASLDGTGTAAFFQGTGFQGPIALAPDAVYYAPEQQSPTFDLPVWRIPK